MRASVTLLEYDHGLIRQMTDILSETNKRGNLARYPKQVVRIAEFFDQYVERHHHAKEERCLFPVAEKISAGVAQMVKDLRQDHAKLKPQIRRFKELAGRKEAYADGTLSHVAKELVQQMSLHIRHEEDLFFPKVEEGISIEQDADIVAAYEGFLTSRFDPGFLKTYEDLVTRLQDELLGPGYYQGIR
jgi:hemerythrin-like domain-containing protein